MENETRKIHRIFFTVATLLVIAVVGAGMYFLRHADIKNEVRPQIPPPPAETNALTVPQMNAWQACAGRQGKPHITLNEESGEQEVFCSFGDKGECTQNELNRDECRIRL